ncbi:MAG TPA: pyridoxamine 5'-phosphate oxidase [Flavipsychrobacter sp.]|nr:pyridoxamine 5'-phosphate oxidase [Flavipsychrobacter sp.]
MSLSSAHIAAIRTDYQLAALNETTVGNDPFAFFGKWFLEAQAAEVIEVNAMTLATVDAQNKPHARIVLLKGLDEKGFVFFTNYDSAKGKEIDANPYAALVFFWQELERQVRIEGSVVRISEEESDSYFASRPEGSKIGAWSSPQSQIIEDRSILEKNYSAFEQKFSGNSIPRPEYWGGYRVIPNKVEFWQGRSNRMHDRVVFLRRVNEWSNVRLAP